MTKRTNTKAANVNTSKAAKVRPVLLSITAETMEGAAKTLASAIGRLEGAKAMLLQEASKAVKALDVPAMSAKQYDRQFKPTFERTLDARVSRGGLKAASAKTYKSETKNVILWLANGGVAVVGMLWSEAVEAARTALPTSKLPDGSPVWERTGGAKGGRPKGSKSGGGVDSASAFLLANGYTFQGDKADGSKGSADDGEGGLNIRPKLAAAMILTGNDASMAQRLVLALDNYRDDFAKWVSTIMSDDDKAKLNLLVAAMPKPDAAAPKAAPVTAPKGGKRSARGSIAAAMANAHAA